MNNKENDILRTILTRPISSQRDLAEQSRYSLGACNQTVRMLTREGFLSDGLQPTAEARAYAAARTPKNAIILAAGFGMRMVPINLSAPKALLEVKGEVLIERLIRQLREAGISEITIVVGFLKEQFDYLIDAYGVRLVVNTSYAAKNNLSSLALAANRIGQTYILPADLWFAENPFRTVELDSWYMVSDAQDPESEVRINRKGELVRVPGEASGNRMIGLACITGDDAQHLCSNLRSMAKHAAYDECFWEAALYEGDRMFIPARMTADALVTEINTYEQLRGADSTSDHLQSDAIDVIANSFGVRAEEIKDIQVLKKGMTNRSFLFSVNDGKYIMRIPGEGTDQLINRAQEAEVYQTISGKGFCDDPVYLNPENGYKITRYLEGIRTADPLSEADLEKCMEKLRQFHEMRLSVAHTFDVFGQIAFYESLWEGRSSMYRDYAATKAHVLSLQPLIDACPKDWCLTHIDAVPDNFLFYTDDDGAERLQLTDWEYAGMQDPHVDLAMWSIYSYYDKDQVDALMELYFGSMPGAGTRGKIYAYVAACGLLWSNWCEYKATLGVEFGEYAMKQYRYAKDFYRYAMEEFANA